MNLFYERGWKDHIGLPHYVALFYNAVPYLLDLVTRGRLWTLTMEIIAFYSLAA